MSFRPFASASALAAIAAFGVGPSQAATPCYDAEVSARIVSQTPTVAPDCDDCILMRWPWIIDLDVRRVHSGDVGRGRLTVLAVQHTAIRRDLGSIRWKLRRNAEGGFNLIGLGRHPARRCAPNEPPASAPITPPEGRALDDLRQAGRARYGPDD